MVNNEPKRQHTVTNSVLKRFTNVNNLFWVYDREDNEYREQHPDDTTVIHNFYTFTTVDGEKSYYLEKLLNTEIEGCIPKIIDKIDEFEPINEEEKNSIAIFVALQQLKTTAYRKDYDEMMKEVHLSIANIAFNNEEYVKKTIRDFNNAREGSEVKINEDPKDLMEFVNQLSKDNIKIAKESHLRMMLEMAEMTSKLLVQMDWFFLKAPKNSSFIISDNPFVLIGPPNGSVGLLTSGAEKTIPLSPKTCLMMLEKGGRMTGMDIDRKMVKAINCRTASFCDRYIISKDKALLERLVKITQIDIKKREPLFTVSTPFSRRQKRKS